MTVKLSLEGLIRLGRKKDIVMNVVLSSYRVLWSVKRKRTVLLEAAALCEYLERRKELPDKFEVLSLMRRFKNEVGERNVMLFMAGPTKSNIPVRKWIDRLASVLRSEGKDKGGFAFMCFHIPIEIVVQ